MNTKNPLLHNNACMVSTYDLLYLMSADVMGNVDLSGVLDKHTRALAIISDSQIDAFIDNHNTRAKARGFDWQEEEHELLSALATELRIRRNAYANRATAH